MLTGRHEGSDTVVPPSNGSATQQSDTTSPVVTADGQSRTLEDGLSSVPAGQNHEATAQHSDGSSSDQQIDNALQNGLPGGEDELDRFESILNQVTHVSSSWMTQASASNPLSCQCMAMIVKPVRCCLLGLASACTLAQHMADDLLS